MVCNSYHSTLFILRETLLWSAAAHHQIYFFGIKSTEYDTDVLGQLSNQMGGGGGGERVLFSEVWIHQFDKKMASASQCGHDHSAPCTLRKDTASCIDCI